MTTGGGGDNPYLGSPPPRPAPATPEPNSTNATVLRAVALGLYLLPALVQATQSLGFSFLGLAVWLLSHLALAIVLAAAAVASRHRVAAGVLLAVLALPMGLVQSFIGVGFGLALVLSALAIALPALSWAITRPFRGPGYAPLAAGVVLLIGFPLVLQLPLFDGGVVLSLIYPLLTPAISVGAIVLAIFLERPRASAPESAVLA